MIRGHPRRHSLRGRLLSVCKKRNFCCCHGIRNCQEFKENRCACQYENRPAFYFQIISKKCLSPYPDRTASDSINKTSHLAGTRAMEKKGRFTRNIYGSGTYKSLPITSILSSPFICRKGPSDRIKKVRAERAQK